MSDENIEARTQKFCDDLVGIIELAINSKIMKPGFRGVRQEGEKKFKAGIRALIPVIDQSPVAPLGRPALLQVITGTAILVFGATYTDSTKSVVFRERASAAGKASAKIRRSENEEGWLPHALKLAVAIRTEDKAVTQADLAERIKLRWALKITCPKSQLIPAISQWEREGKLPRRNTR